MPKPQRHGYIERGDELFLSDFFKQNHHVYSEGRCGELIVNIGEDLNFKMPQIPQGEQILWFEVLNKMCQPNGLARRKSYFEKFTAARKAEISEITEKIRSDYTNNPLF